MKCNSTTIQRWGSREIRGPHMNRKYRKPDLALTWRRFCLPLNPGSRLGLERQQTNQSEQMFPWRKLGFNGMKVLEGRESVTGQCTSVRQPDHSGAPKHSQPVILSTRNTSWQHLGAIFVPYPQSPIWCWCFPAAPSDDITSQCKLRKSSLKYLKTVQQSHLETNSVTEQWRFLESFWVFILCSSNRNWQQHLRASFSKYFERGLP